jgi:uncharacterized protein (TIGR02646 family)
VLHIDRKIKNLPAKLLREMKRATAAAGNFFSTAPRTRAQERFTFKDSLWKQAKPYLEELFHNICCYCEWPLEPKEGFIEHFRPKIEALGVDGKSAPDWYWWLAYTWDNLFLACKTCNNNKRTHFPVLGDRAPFGALGEELLNERALLLDPCLDRPELYLQFNEDGTVISVPSHDPAEQARFTGYDRGETTIKILGLNRAALIKAREHAAHEVKFLYQSLLNDPQKLSPRDIGSLFAPTLPHAAARRQTVARLIHQTDQGLIKSNTRLRMLIDELSDELVAELGALKLREKPAPVPKPVKTTAPVYEAAYIQKLEIHNFRAVDELSLDFSEQPSGVCWKMLLGENGTGKSSVLKATALALLGASSYKEHGERLRLTPDRFFNRKVRQKDGFIRLTTTKGTVELSFTKVKGSLRFESGASPMSIFLRGYGATRLLSHGSAGEIRNRGAEMMNVENLFDPSACLSDADEWLTGLNQDQFNSVGLTLKDLLQLDEVKEPLTRKGRSGNRQVYLNVGHGPLPLEEQSDGYQAVLALVTDIMAGVPHTIHDMQQASGIVLLDEIDAHLHPRWKMKIVKGLREAFPNIQFLVTTHEPLCLRGLLEHEIAVMRRQGKQVVVRDDIPSPAGLRVDQLLTSELFGLYTTIDPDIDKKFERYYELLAMHRRGARQEKEFQRLRSELNRYNKLGYTRRDQLVYEIIDEYLAIESEIVSADERRRLRNSTKQRVTELWASINARSEVTG